MKSCKFLCIITVLTIFFLHLNVIPLSAQESFRIIPGAKFLIGMDWGNFWLWGDLLIPAGGQLGSGTKIDSSSLGLDWGETTSVRFNSIILSDHLVELDYLSYSPSGLKRPSKSFRFQNRTYSPEDLLETKLDFNWFRFCYGYKLWDMSEFWIAPKIGIHHIRHTATINGFSEEEGFISNTRSLDGTYPVVGLETRYLFPYGIDLGLSFEGIHLITRGFLAQTQINVQWEVHPDVVLFLGLAGKVVQYIEDNQPLNNEWFYILSGWSAGISFTF